MVLVPLLELDDDQRWRAVKSRDPRFDGQFIVGVRTTGIYCRPSCPTPVQPLRRNVNFFGTAAAAQRAGLRACKRCRPDATPGSPEWNLRSDLIGRAMTLINRGWLDTHTVSELASELGVTERHLRRLMIESVGAPPFAIARAVRAQTARILIETTGMKFTDVAYAAGFSSLRQFNDTVRAVFASTPTELRGRADGPSGSGQLSLRLPYRAPMADDYLLSWWSGRLVEGVGHVTDGVLTTALRLPNGNGLARLTPQDGWMQCELELDATADLAPAVAQCRSMLDLDADPTHIEDGLRVLAPIAPFVDALPGLRAPGSCDGFATLVFAILGQQRSVAAARTIAGRIVARSRTEEHAALAPFPTPAQVAELDLDDIGLTTRSIATIRAVAEHFDGTADTLAPGADREAIEANLLAIKGIGPWTVRYLAMRVFADPDVWLAGDLVAERAAATLGLDLADIEQVRPWRTYLTHHLWAASASLKGRT